MRSIQLFQVTENRQIARDTYLLELEGDTAGLSHPGQFVNVDIPGFYLRRPLSVCAWRPGHLTLMYKILGQGTDALSNIAPSETLDVLSGLGNGFSIPEGVSTPLVVGGGIGVAPLLALTGALVKAGTKPTVIFGFGSEDEVALVEEIETLGASVSITTVDGTAGTPGFVTTAMMQADATWDYVYACGPTPMLKAVFAAAGTPGQYSMEERMACGFGACMGCVLETKEGLQRVCKEGPVFYSEDLPW